MKIALIDDHTLLLQALQAELKELPGVTHVSCYAHPDDFMKSINITAYDVVFLDIMFKDANGFGVLQQLKTQCFPGKIIMLSASVSAYTLNKAIRDGADGFIGKDADKSELFIAIGKALNGEFYIGRTLKKYADDLLFQRNQGVLSERETEIVALIAQGFNYKEIGEKLFISPRTVEAHRNNILQKLQLKNTSELIRFAILNHLI